MYLFAKAAVPKYQKLSDLHTEIIVSQFRSLEI